MPFLNLLNLFKTKNTPVNLPIAEKVTCPTCNVLLNKVPKSKTKCKNCSNLIFVRTHFQTKNKLYLTEKQTSDFDEEKAQFYFSKHWLEQMNMMGISETEIAAERQSLKEKWGEGHPSFQDLMWNLFNKQVMKLAKKSANYHDFKMLYFEWALFACEIDVNPRDLQKESHKYTLLEYQKSEHINKVSVLSNQGCEECRAFDGKVFLIEDILTAPILPNVTCTHKLESGDKYPWCRCIYQAVIEF